MLWEQKQYKAVALGLAAMHVYVEAALIAFNSSLNDTFEIIRNAPRREERIKISRAVLSSLPPKESGELAKQLLLAGCIDTSLALKYLPDNAHVSDIKEQMSDYISTMCEYITNTNILISNTKASITNTHRMFTNRKKAKIRISIGEKCKVCDNLLNLQSSIAFNCGHVVHKSCAEYDCPICGTSAIMNIDKYLD